MTLWRAGAGAGLGRRALFWPFLALLLPLGMGMGGCGTAESAPISVRPGIEVLLADSLHRVEGMRVELVTNHTALDRAGTHAIDLLNDHPGVELVALYSPEHGIRGEAEAGELVESGVDPRTGLTVHSLYGTTRKPTEAMLEGVDILLFDIQDIGTRYYTYIYTLALAMEAAGEAGIPFLVLDRPNPIGGTAVQGNLLDPAFASFVGMYPIPIRHGMTVGELARLYQRHFGVEAELGVIPMEGWRRGMLFSETGLVWRPPSPNMPNLESALHYPGSCLFEGTNLSVGRGTDRAFQQVGAPWLDGVALAEAFAQWQLPGVRAEAVRFTPERAGDGKFSGEVVAGVRLVVTDAERYDPVAAGIVLLVEARRMSGEAWGWNASHFDRLAGGSALREGIERGLDPEALMAGWDAALRDFDQLRAPLLLYPG